MLKILLLVCFTMSIFFAGAQEKAPAVAGIKKVSAKDVRTMMDTTSGPMIVNFWASWCGPCIREIPWFDSIITAKKSTVKLLLVSLDFPEMYPRQLAYFVKKQGYKGEVVFLNETNTQQFVNVIEPKWTGAIPASILVNNDKKYYEVFNHQLTKERFSLELDKLQAQP